jgi:hypothetical protein
MKKMKLLAVAVVSALMFSSCAMVKSPLMAVIYTDVKGPVTATSNSVSSKVGVASASCILGIVATGDASIDAAAKKAGITKIHHVDEHATNILGIYATYEVMVYGE